MRAQPLQILRERQSPGNPISLGERSGSAEKMRSISRDSFFAHVEPGDVVSRMVATTERAPKSSSLFPSGKRLISHLEATDLPLTS